MKRAALALLLGCGSSETWSQRYEPPQDTSEVISAVSSFIECDSVRRGGIISWRPQSFECKGIASDGCATLESPPRVDVVYRGSAWGTSLAHELCHVCGYLDENEAQGCAYRAWKAAGH